MRWKLTALVLLLALGWVTWWWVATTGFQRSVAVWLDARRAENWQAEVDATTRSGFPFRAGTTLEGVALGDPRIGAVLNAPQVAITAPLYWPGYITVTLPDAPVTLASPTDRLALTPTDARATMRLRPSRALQLEAMSARSGALALDLPEGRLLSLSALAAQVQQTPEPDRYDIDFDAIDLAPGSVLRQALKLPDTWPDAFEAFAARMTVTFDRPWDRSAIEVSRPQPRQIVLHQAEVIWAELRLSAAADLTVDAAGVPSGTLRLGADSWQTMLDLASGSGALAPGMRPQIESGLGLLSGLSGNAETLDVEITIDDGRMRIGFIPLGRAPRLILR